MSLSLLAHLFPYFKGSQEDVATTSLNYIVSASSDINRAFTKHLGDVLETEITDILQFHCQAVGENYERPDMSGTDAEGNEIILIESKLYAALTVNQPNEYLKRLIRSRGTGLVFICPELRKKGLWYEVLEIAGKEFEYKTVCDFCIETEGGVRMGITTWKAVLDYLEQVSITNAPAVVSDIKQLQGYCAQLDSEAFIPFTEEDLGADVAIKNERHYRLLDELVNALKAEMGDEISLKGLRATPVWSGYKRALKIDDLAIMIDYDTKKWKKTESKVTPYWLQIKRIVEERWLFDECCEKAMKKIAPELKDGTYIALIPKRYVALNEIVEDMKKQVLEYFEIFKETEEQEE